MRLVPPGDDDARLYGWPRPGAVIDSLPGLVPLLAFAAGRARDENLRAVAIAHTRSLVAMCVRADGSVVQSASFDEMGFLGHRVSINGSGPHSTWAGMGDARAGSGRPSVEQRVC